MASQLSLQDRRPSPNLALNLASNNPFRRAISPQPPSYSSLSPRSPADVDERRASTNPFLDTYQSKSPPQSTKPTQASFPQRQDASGMPAAQMSRQNAGRATDLLADMTLRDNSQPPPSDRHLPRRPPPPPNPQHRHTHSQEANRLASQNPRPDLFGLTGPPPRPQNENRRPRPRPRRNSESSMMDFKGDAYLPRERRPGDREPGPRDRERERERRDKDSNGKSRQPKKVRPPRGLDLIDKLDVTSIYGAGMVHHDGPFDACNPHRNKKGARAAPMQAFPEGSANNVMGGSGPVNKQIDYDMFHGRSHQGYNDYNESAQYKSTPQPPKPRQHNGKEKQSSWDAKEKIEPILGQETAGLGASTFFEGTAVSRAALQQREYEGDEPMPAGGGLQRKRSIAQKIRGMSRPRAGWGDGSPPVRSPDARHPGSPSQHSGPQSAGGRGRMNEPNPFFNDALPDKKSGNVAVTAVGSSSDAGRTRARTNTNGSATQQSPPLEPRESDDWGLDERETAKPNGGSSGPGLLGRVKSLRGRKQRPDRFGPS